MHLWLLCINLAQSWPWKSSKVKNGLVDDKEHAIFGVEEGYDNPREKKWNFFEKESDFPKLILLEYTPGTEMTSDCLCLNGKALFIAVKSVEQALWGVIVKWELLDELKCFSDEMIHYKAVFISY